MGSSRRVVIKGLLLATQLQTSDIGLAAINASDVGNGPVIMIRFTVGTATTDSTISIPSGGRVVRSRTEITTPYSSAGTLNIGGTTTSNKYQVSDTDIDEQTADVYDKYQDTAADVSIVRATVGGAPAAGAATISIWYVNPAT